MLLLSVIFLREQLTAVFLIAMLVMIVGTALIDYETLVHSHTHVHRHYVTHTHDGTTHTHTIELSHEHSHVIDEDKHGHTHPLAELEGCLYHRTV